MQLEANRLRLFLLTVLLVSMVATGIELLLLEHTESTTQLVPLVLLAAGLLAATLVAIRAERTTVMFFRAIMALFVVAGALGFYLHYRSNVEFELEMNPALKGWELWRKTLMGATPTLSPGVMSQLGLLGLLYTYHHPRLGSADAAGEENS
jgi:hypothetical protein